MSVPPTHALKIIHGLTNEHAVGEIRVPCQPSRLRATSVQKQGSLPVLARAKFVSYIVAVRVQVCERQGYFNVFRPLSRAR